uniref:Uncharacterized protein n=1 Tax=Anguilla anguilla TaxID=7936 RepID=A0A0E9X5R3_ANGAN
MQENQVFTNSRLCQLCFLAVSLNSDERIYEFLFQITVNHTRHASECIILFYKSHLPLEQHYIYVVMHAI